jgi:hypothetical protein
MCHATEMADKITDYMIHNVVCLKRAAIDVSYPISST